MTRILLLLMLGCQSASQGLNDTGNGVDGPIADTDIEFFEGPAAEERATLFSEDELPVFEIWLDDSEIQDLISDPYSYVKGTLRYRDVIYEDVAVRTKGENSWRPINEKASLKIDLNHYDTGPGDVLGLKKITLNAMNEDYSMMHERVAYRMFREAGVPAARSTHAIVYLNDELYGLFAHVESVDDTMIGRWFEDNSGSLFEQHDADYYTDYVQNNTYFQLEEGDDNRDKLQALADTLAYSGEDALEAAGEHINWDTSSLTGRSAQSS